jgi:hypothetical protein
MRGVVVEVGLRGRVGHQRDPDVVATRAHGKHDLDRIAGMGVAIEIIVASRATVDQVVVARDDGVAIAIVVVVRRNGRGGAWLRAKQPPANQHCTHDQQ